MEIKRIMFLSVFFICGTVTGLMATINDEDVEAIKKEMNKIKTDEACIAAEATGEKLQDAFDMALTNVYFSINSQRILQGLPPIDIETIRPYAHSLSMKRGSMQRVLVYIVWADLEKGGTVNRKSPSAGIVADSPADTIEVVVTIPLTHTPVDPSDSEPANEEQDKTTTTSYLPLTSYTSSSDAIEEVLASLCLTEMIIDAVQQLAAFKLEQKISGYGRYYVNYQLQGDTYLLFFNKERVIRGILEVRSDGIVRNVKTNELDDINNYSDCKAYWFK